MTISRCEIVNSYWSSSEMKPTTSLTSLLTRDSGGSVRRLVWSPTAGEARVLLLRPSWGIRAPGVRPDRSSQTKKTPASSSSSSWSGPAAQPSLSARRPRRSGSGPRSHRRPTWAGDVPATTPWRKSWPKPPRRFAGPRSSQKASGETSCCATRDLEPGASSAGWPGTTSRLLPSPDDFDCAVVEQVATASRRSSWTGPLREASSRNGERELIEETRSGAVSLRAYAASTEPRAMTLSTSAEPAPNVGSGSSRAWRWRDEAASRFHEPAERRHPFGASTNAAAFQCRSSRLWSAVSSRTSVRSSQRVNGRRITQQALPQRPLCAAKITRQNQVSAERVGESGHGFNDFVDDRRGESPGEVARGVGGEGFASNERERFSAKFQCCLLVRLPGLDGETLELVPVSRGVDELIARSTRCGREVAFSPTTLRALAM